MLQELFPKQETRARFCVGPLRDFIEGYAGRLVERGYAEFTRRDKLRAVADLNRWLEENGLEASDLDDTIVRKFVQFMLCRGRTRRNLDVAARQFLDYLRELSVAKPPEIVVVEDNDLVRFLRSYRKYLVEQRALAEPTIKYYLEFARSFLVDRHGNEELRFESLRADHVTSFVLKQAHRLGSRRAPMMVTSLRSLLRYLFANGLTDVDLSTCVPTVPHWRLSTIPRYIKQDQVELLLESCRRETPVGKRNYAILLLIARLGLRAGEVVRLTLDDLDWQAAEIIIRSKGGGLDRLPLLVEVGEALVAYLRDGRPTCSTRRFFVKARAPVNEFSGASTVSTIVRRALERAGLEPPHKGAHLLRHSLATSMLGNGATLSEIGELLRHKLTQTTEIYAKVDIGSLRALAQPWPLAEGEL